LFWIAAPATDLDILEHVAAAARIAESDDRGSVLASPPIRPDRS
jgi:hypothetical protein